MSDKLTISEDVVAREVSGEMVLLDLASGLYFGLDTVGGRIWELLSERAHTLSELADTIEAEFDAPRDVIEADIKALATDMREKDLIQPEAA